MSQIIRNNAIEDDHWQVLRLADGETPENVALPGGAVLFPLAVWLTRRDEILARGADGNAAIGVWLTGGEDPAPLAPDFSFLQLIAVDFPKFVNGRGYSTARLLRSRWGYAGELRAIGDVLHDQLFYLRRVGFTSFALRADKNIDKALATAFATFREPYQSAVDQKQPLFRRRSA